MESLKIFKKGDKVRHKFRDEGLLTVVGFHYTQSKVVCESEWGVLSLFEENLELDKNAVVHQLLKDL